MRLLKWILAVCFCCESVFAVDDDFEYSLSVSTPYLNLKLEMKDELFYPIFPKLNECLLAKDLVDDCVGFVSCTFNSFFQHQEKQKGDWVWNSWKYKRYPFDNPSKSP